MSRSGPPANLSAYVAWPTPASVAADERRLKQIATSMTSDLLKATVSGGVHRRFTALRVLGSMLHSLFCGNKAMDAKIRAIPSLGGYTLHKLSDWLAYAHACGVPTVPHELGPTLTQGEIEQAFQALDSRDYNLLPEAVRSTVLPWIAAQQERGWMWRYEFCAPETIKRVLGCIRPPEYLSVTRVAIPFSVDQRVLHCMWDSRLEENEPTHLIARPWVQAKFEAGFPVEFRVFRTPDGFAGCNYYVQRPLPQHYAEALEQAVRKTKFFEGLAKNLDTLPGRPAFPSAYTVDWLLTESGQLLMIEAGPPFDPRGRGAHPCCFAPANLTAGRQLLAGEEGSLCYCPPAIQPSVDRVKAGEHPVKVGREAGLNPMLLLSFAAIQGDPRAQFIAKEITERPELGE